MSPHPRLPLKLRTCFGSKGSGVRIEREKRGKAISAGIAKKELEKLKEQQKRRRH